MKDAKEALLDYLSWFRDPEKAARLFAEDGILNCRPLSSLGVEPAVRRTGADRRETCVGALGLPQRSGSSGPRM